MVGFPSREIRLSNMRSFFSSLVAVSLLMHAALGCCWHQSHDESCGDEHAIVQCGHDGAHHNDDCDEHGQRNHEPCSGQHCHGVCNYLPIQKTQLDDLKLQLPLDFAINAPIACDIQVVVVQTSAGNCESVAGPPVRIHLLHQILLI
jgi:hypothetical protein